jgi:hypothetical protein
MDITISQACAHEGMIPMKNRSTKPKKEVLVGPRFNVSDISKFLPSAASPLTNSCTYCQGTSSK